VNLFPKPNNVVTWFFLDTGILFYAIK